MRVCSRGRERDWPALRMGTVGGLGGRWGDGRGRRGTFFEGLAFAADEAGGAMQDCEGGDEGGVGEMLGVHSAEARYGEVIGAGEDDVEGFAGGGVVADEGAVGAESAQLTQSGDHGGVRCAFLELRRLKSFGRFSTCPVRS